MTQTQSAGAPVPPAPEATGRPWQGSVSAQITRVGVDTIEEIDYTEGVFTRRFRVISGESPPSLVVLDLPARQQLLAELRDELAGPPPGTDLVALGAFVDLLEDSIATAPSTRFDQARFGAVTHDETRGIYYGHLGLGVDLVGTVRDDRSTLSFEQHVVTMLGGRYRPLSVPDLRSLISALSAYLAATADPDPGWAQILADAQAAAQAAAGPD